MGKSFLFVGHDLKFIKEFIEFLTYCRHVKGVETVSYKGHQLPRDESVVNATNRCDVIFCEWALDNAVYFSNNKPAGKRLVVRLHAQELRCFKSKYLAKINWREVDLLIVISPAIKERVASLYPELQGKIKFIPNYVPDRKVGRGGYSRGRQFRLGILGIVPALKRVDLAFDLLRHLRSVDARYTLSVKSGLPSDYEWMKKRTGEIRWYENTFKRNQDLVVNGSVSFDKFSDDVASWYQSIGVILSVSDTEGSHQSVAEGMASGCVPVIRNWEGARELYGEPAFEDVEEMADYILSLKSDFFYSRSSILAYQRYLKYYTFERVSEKLLTSITFD